MLRLRSKNLSKPTRQYLASLQAEVDAQTDRKAKSDRIDALWSGKTNTRAGQAAFEEIKKALDDTLNFGFYHTEKVTKALISSLHQNKPHMYEIKDKEMTFLKLACTEKTYKEIADEMHMSPKTIDGYREALFEKLEVKSRVGLVLYAIKNNIYRL